MFEKKSKDESDEEKEKDDDGESLKVGQEIIDLLKLPEENILFDFDSENQSLTIYNVSRTESRKAKKALERQVRKLTKEN